ncbi:MAG: alpha/beta fold hydrolase [Candidatus Woesearchaeota archaeon]|jgi:pimeloyl-ACP methyl ester carboxylesterase
MTTNIKNKKKQNSSHVNTPNHNPANTPSPVKDILEREIQSITLLFRAKHFAIKHKHHIKKTGITTLACIIFLLIVFLILTAIFSVKEDLKISITQRHISLFTTKENPAKLTIPVNLETSRLCKASCTQNFININSNKIMSSEKIIFRTSKNIRFEQTISPTILGEGQDIYVYSISCINIATRTCPAGNNSISETAIITIQRKLDLEELSMKNTQQSLLQNSYDKFNEGRSKLDKAENIILQTKYAKVDDITFNINNANKQIQPLSNALTLSTSSWLTRNHTLVQKTIQTTNLTKLSTNFNATTNTILNETKLRIETHNNTITSAYFLKEKTELTKITTKKSEQFTPSVNSEIANHISEAESLLLFVYRSIERKDFSNYYDLSLTLLSVDTSLDSARNLYTTNLINNTQFIKADLDILLTTNDYCTILNYTNSDIAPNNNDETNTTNNNTSNNNNHNNNRNNKRDNNNRNNNNNNDFLNYFSSCTQNISEQLINFENTNYDAINLKLTNMCENYDLLEAEKTNILNQVLLNRNNQTSQFLSAVDNESIKYRTHILTQYKQQLINRTDFAALRAIELIDNYILQITSNQTINEQLLINPTFNTSLFKFFLPINFTLTAMTSCTQINSNSFININLSYETIIDIATQTYLDSLPNLEPLCCFKNECTPCVNNESNNYPLLLVHGHGFYSGNDPTSPAQVYNSFEEILLNEQKYIPAGYIKEKDDSITIDSLGFINAPFVYKASYYPDELLNNESITIFAGRINSIIENVKEETGKDKVIIIAHSMGGLVTREYIKNYGTNNVDKIIIVGTPNNGVPPETTVFCKLFGRDKECDEMTINSDFLINLQQEPIPNIPIFTIRGEGCTTFGSDGDGIVQSASVPLNYSQNFAFNSICSLTGGAHMNLLNPYKNPEIYSKIKEILDE